MRNSSLIVVDIFLIVVDGVYSCEAFMPYYWHTW